MPAEPVSPLVALPEASRRYGDIGPTSGKPRWGMAVDTERCIGCWSCAVICKSENDVPLGMWWNRILTAGERLDRPEHTEHGGLAMHWVPLSCQHCDDAPCQKVCPTQATFTNRHGVVLVTADDCIGCRCHSTGWRSSAPPPRWRPPPCPSSPTSAGRS